MRLKAVRLIIQFQLARPAKDATKSVFGLDFGYTFQLTRPAKDATQPREC